MPPHFWNWIIRPFLLTLTGLLLQVAVNDNVRIISYGHAVPVLAPESWHATTTEELSVELLSSKIDSMMASLRRCVQYPGMALAVVKTRNNNGEYAEDPIVLVRNYGVLDVVTKRPVDSGSRFCIGSITKGFTAALLAQIMIENKTYSLDTPIHKLLDPGFQFSDTERTEKTNVRDLLAHRVGVAKHFGAFLMGYNLTRSEIVRRVRHLPQLQPFRKSQVYNNFMYVVAGQVAEKLNGTWWENQVLWRFFKKLKMDKTVFADRVSDWMDNFALPHALADGRLVPLREKVTGNILRPVGPAGSICSTVSDMAEWLLMHLNNGTNRQGEPILSPAVLKGLFTFQNLFPLPRKSDKNSLNYGASAGGYGLGWVVGHYRNRTRVFHSGFANYYYAMVSLLPDDGIAIITVLNGPHLIKCDNGMKALHFYITDLLLGEKPWLDYSTVCHYPREFVHRNIGLSPNMKATTQSLQDRTSQSMVNKLFTTSEKRSSSPSGSTEAIDGSPAGHSASADDASDSTTETNFETTLPINIQDSTCDSSNCDMFMPDWTSTELIDFHTEPNDVSEFAAETVPLQTMHNQNAATLSSAPESTKNEPVFKSESSSSKDSNDVDDVEHSSRMPPDKVTIARLHPVRRLRVRKRPNTKGKQTSVSTTSMPPVKTDTITSHEHSSLERLSVPSDKISENISSTAANHRALSSRTSTSTQHNDVYGLKESVFKSAYSVKPDDSNEEHSTVFPMFQGKVRVHFTGQNQSNSTFGRPLRLQLVRRRPLRRRPKRNPAIFSVLKPFQGTYNNPFFGDVIINLNRSVPALQFNYGYYGKASLTPVSLDLGSPIVFQMHFFNSIWYQSGSDDMKLFSKLGVFNVQFGSSKNDGSIDKLVVFLFDTEKPPIFTRHL